MSLTTSGTLATLVKNLRIPGAVGIANPLAFTAFTYGAWFYFNAWPSTGLRHALMCHGPESVRSRISVQDNGSLVLEIDDVDKGTSSPLSLHTWYQIIYSKTGSVNHKVKVVTVDPFTNVPDAGATVISSAQAHGIQNALSFELYIRPSYYVCNFRFAQYDLGENALISEKNSWLPASGSYYMVCPLRTPLDTSSFHGLTGGVNNGYLELFLWNVITGDTITRNDDPPHLVTAVCKTAFYFDAVGSLAHAPLIGPTEVGIGFFPIGYQPDDDGRLPADVTIVCQEWYMQGSQTGSILAPYIRSFSQVPFGTGDTYPNSPDYAVVGGSIKPRIDVGALGYCSDAGGGPCSGFAQCRSPVTESTLTRDEVYNNQLEYMDVRWGPSGSSGSTNCCTFNLSALGYRITYVGSFDDVVEPGEEDVTPCVDDHRAWWFDSFNDSTLDAAYTVDGSIILNPTIGYEGSPAITGTGALTVTLAPDTRSFSVSFKHRF